MANNETIKLKVSSNSKNISLNIQNSNPYYSLNAQNGNPYYVGARAYVEQNEDGATITIIDKEGETTATVNNGADGATGADGVGIESIDKTSTVGLVDTYTITYTDDSTSTFDVTNGKDAENAITDVEVNGVSVVSDSVAEITVPTDTADLTNGAGYITGYTETDPTVPSWAKASSKPSYAFSEIDSKPTSVSGYGITDAYTKSEIDGLVSGVLHYKGTKATTSALPSSGNTTGDVWHVTADGSEWAWDGTQWQELGTAVDLSGYVPTSRTVNGKALSSNITLSASDVSALPNSTVIPTKTSDLTNDSGFSSVSVIARGSAGANIADITIDGVTKKIYSPEEVFLATYGTTTSAQIETAYQNGLVVCTKYGNQIYTLCMRESGSVHNFSSTSKYEDGDVYISVIRCTNSVWSTVATVIPASASDIPAATSDLTNDSGFITASDIPVEVFWATYGTTTTAEIVQATIASKIIFAEYGSRIYSLSKINSSSSHDFTCFDSGVEYCISCNGNVWTASQTSFVPLDSYGKVDASYLPVYSGGVSP